MWQRLALGLKFREIAANLNISLGTVHSIFKPFEATGEVSTKKHQKHDRKLDNYRKIYIIGLILSCPTLELSKLVQAIADISNTNVSRSTLCRLLAHYGFTRKKVQKIALQRRVDFRVSFMTNAFIFSKDKFVWVDETGCKGKDMLRCTER